MYNTYMNVSDRDRYNDFGRGLTQLAPRHVNSSEGKSIDRKHDIAFSYRNIRHDRYEFEMTGQGSKRSLGIESYSASVVQSSVLQWLTRTLDDKYRRVILPPVHTNVCTLISIYILGQSSSNISTKNNSFQVTRFLKVFKNVKIMNILKIST